MQVSTDGRCPSCGSYKLTPGITTDEITVSCCDCSIYYIRLTGAAAMLYRKANPGKPGTYQDDDIEKKLESAWKTSELAECMSLLEQLVNGFHRHNTSAELLAEACAKIESLKKFIATKI